MGSLRQHGKLGLDHLHDHRGHGWALPRWHEMHHADKSPSWDKTSSPSLSPTRSASSSATMEQLTIGGSVSSMVPEEERMVSRFAQCKLKDSGRSPSPSASSNSSGGSLESRSSRERRTSMGLPPLQQVQSEVNLRGVFSMKSPHRRTTAPLPDIIRADSEASLRTAERALHGSSQGVRAGGAQTSSVGSVVELTHQQKQLLFGT